MILEILKYILLVLGIVAVGAFIIWGLVSLILIIIEPHGNQKGNTNNVQEKQITYVPQKLITQEPVYENYVSEKEEVQDFDEQKALEEEKALMQGTSFGELSAEEEEFIREKQRNIEERLASKNVQEETIEDDFDLDSIFIDEDEKEEVQEEQPDEEDEEDIEALINKILDGEIDEEDNVEEVQEEQLTQENEGTTEGIVEEINEENNELDLVEEINEENNELDLVEEEQEEIETEEIEELKEQEEIEETEEFEDSNDKVKELEEQLARQREEFEERLKQMQEMHDKSKEEESLKAEKIASLEKMLEEKEAEKLALAEENQRIAKEAEEKQANKSTSALTLEEYEERLETLRERLRNNEKDLKPVKKEYIPLAKIKARLEKDNVKLRRKEAMVAKQKVVLYGVNNYVDIDEEKAKKLAEDLDLLEGLRLSVGHCEEVMKANEERFPILENAYNSLIETNAHLKADIEECLNKIEEIKNQTNNEE